jgi:hypothetical protein
MTETYLVPDKAQSLIGYVCVSTDGRTGIVTAQDGDRWLGLELDYKTLWWSGPPQVVREVTRDEWIQALESVRQQRQASQMWAHASHWVDV